MKAYRVKVSRGEDGWLVAEGANLRGLVTQGRDLNELVSMIHDAIEQLTDSSSFSIQLLLPADIKIAPSRRKAAKKQRRRAA
jgi:predicted RNase H-like HicB family nuclease